MLMICFFKISPKNCIYLIAISILLFAACSKQLFSEKHSFQNVESPVENRKLNDFLSTGVEKPLNMKNVKADDIIGVARKYLNVPHCMGGTTSRCMDCSGLLFTSFAQFGIQIPRSSEEQARYGHIIPNLDQLKRGDLVFFIGTYKTNRFITHSGLYLGNNEFIHASTSRGVTITSIYDPWWNEKFVFGTRVFD
jgi:murein DD-endopeptidase / murein LD-carboxypeptidase